MLDPVFNVSAVRHNFTTTQVLSPNQLCSGGFNSVNGALKSYLAGAIASGWAKYGGLSNPNIPRDRLGLRRARLEAIGHGRAPTSRLDRKGRTSTSRPSRMAPAREW